jgi:hypothetical protein
MKRCIIWAVFFSSLLLGVSGAAAAQNGGVCTNDSIAGLWGYVETGTLIFPAPTGAIPYASVGKYAIDRDGNVWGARTASAAGTIMKATIKGTATVNPDCTGTLTVNFYDPLSGSFMGAAVKYVVYEDNSKAAHMIITSSSAQAVLTTEAKKLFPNGNWESWHPDN